MCGRGGAAVRRNAVRHRVWRPRATTTLMGGVPRNRCLTMFLCGAVAAGTSLAAARLEAQASTPCQLLCAPALALYPTLNRSPIAGAPRVQRLSDGRVSRVPAASNFQLTLVGTARTAIPRVGLVGSVQWLPTATESGNPFTRYTASELTTAHLRANAPTATFAVTGALVRPADTRGWLGLDAHVGDLYSQAQRPDDRSSYTHKLDLELVADAFPFARLPRVVWAHGVALTVILDHVATGLPHAGDEVPRGERRYLDAARPLTLLAGVTLPLATSAP